MLGNVDFFPSPSLPSCSPVTICPTTVVPTLSAFIPLPLKSRSFPCGPRQTLGANKKLEHLWSHTLNSMKKWHSLKLDETKYTLTQVLQVERITSHGSHRKVASMTLIHFLLFSCLYSLYASMQESHIVYVIRQPDACLLSSVTLMTAAVLCRWFPASIQPHELTKLNYCFMTEYCIK